jgi:hypothetical protein
VTAAERARAERGAKPKQVAGDPLAARQWDMAMIGATADGSYSA